MKFRAYGLNLFHNVSNQITYRLPIHFRWSHSTQGYL